jgi:predicted hydrocarbon binding protein
MDRLDVLIAALDAAERFPRAAGALGGAVARAADIAARVPVLGVLVPAWLRFAPRAFLGRESGLALHQADRGRAELSIGGFRDIALGVGILRALHDVVHARLGEAGAAPVLYEIGRRAGIAEVQDVKRSGAWMPPDVAAALGRAGLIDLVRRDARAARILAYGARRMGEVLMADTGGGRLARFDVSKDPIEVDIAECPEAKAVGPAAGPACHLYRGFVAGWVKELAGEAVLVEEATCAAAGAPCCRFLVRRAAALIAGAEVKSSRLERSENG